MNEPVYRLNGKTVSRKAFLAQKRGLSDGVPMTASHKWPMRSTFGGVHPNQIGKARQRCEECGVKVKFYQDGDVEWSSRKNKKDYLRALGYCDRDAGYGDAFPLTY